MSRNRNDAKTTTQPGAATMTSGCPMCCLPRPVEELDERCPRCGYTVNVLAYFDDEIAELLTAAKKAA